MLACVIAAFMIISLISAGNEYVSGFITSYIFMPVQQLFGAEEPPPKSRDELEAEVLALSEENRRLREELAGHYDIIAENEELRKYLNIKKQNSSVSLMTASVISRDPNENFYGFSLDKGACDGVELNAPVVTDKGLVGFVSSVSVRSCRVTTVFSPDAAIGASVKRTGSGGIISGSAELSDKGMTEMKNLPADSKIMNGDMVVTSGYGGIFPKNLQIGRIRAVRRDSFTAMPVAEVEPYEDIRNIVSAAIITDFSGKDVLRQKEK